MNARLLLAIVACSTVSSLAAASPATLPYDRGVAGVLQRAKLRGKTIVTHDTMIGGGSRKKVESYAPRNGRLERFIVRVDGTHDSGASFSNIHTYPAKTTADIHDVLRDFDRAVSGGSIVAPKMTTAIRGVYGLVRTAFFGAETTMQSTKTPAGETSTRFGMKLTDAHFAMNPDGSTTVTDERGTMSFPKPGIRRIK